MIGSRIMSPMSEATRARINVTSATTGRRSAKAESRCMSPQSPQSVNTSKFIDRSVDPIEYERILSEMNKKKYNNNKLRL